MLIVANWTFLTNHAQALLCIAQDPEMRLRDIAASRGAGWAAARRHAGSGTLPPGRPLAPISAAMARAGRAGREGRSGKRELTAVAASRDTAAVMLCW